MTTDQVACADVVTSLIGGLRERSSAIQCPLTDLRRRDGLHERNSHGVHDCFVTLTKRPVHEPQSLQSHIRLPSVKSLDGKPEQIRHQEVE
jgi:hypothetical protein